MTQALSIREAGDALVGLIGVPEDRAPEAESYRPPAIRREREGSSLAEGAAIVETLIAPKRAQPVGKARSRPVQRRDTGAMSVEEGANAIHALIAKPQKARSASTNLPSVDFYSRDDVAVIEDRVRREGKLKNKQAVLNIAVHQFMDFIRLVQSEFPNLNSWADTVGLANNPVAAVKFNAYRQQAHAVLPVLERCWNEVEAERQSLFEEYAADADARFQEANPDWSVEHSAELADMLKSGGLAERQIRDLYHGRGGVALAGNPHAEQAIADAARWRTRQRLDTYHEIYAACVETLMDIGFSDKELNAIAHGAQVSLRDHRIQQILADATRLRMSKKKERRDD